MKPVIALVGRPNVGKSTLFNRLTRSRDALVADLPGLTRDRHYGEGRMGERPFLVIDTGGFEPVAKEGIMHQMAKQTKQAVAEADVIVFIVDGRQGLTPHDKTITEFLRKAGRPVVLVVNKAEGMKYSAVASDFYELGLGDPLAVSSAHGDGVHDMLDEALNIAFANQPPTTEEVDPAVRGTKIAIVGRPNVGKSTLVNRLIGEDRVLTGPEPGITRDAIAVDWAWAGRPIRLFDTAGMRRRARVEAQLERLSVADARRAVRFAETVILVSDAQQPLERQDLTIANLVAEEGRAIVLAANKWDVVKDQKAALARLRERLEESLPQLRGVALVPVSGLTGYGIDALMKGVFAADAVWNRRVPTAALNRWLSAIQEHHPPPLAGGRRLRLRYITQVNTRPPSFALFASQPGELPESYRRYLVNALREDLKLPGTPIRLMLRKGENPYAPGRGA